MSTTGYIVNTGTSTAPVYQDLIDVFEPLGVGTKAPATGFSTRMNGTEQDLNAIFAQYDTSTTVAPTKMLSLTGKDLEITTRGILKELTPRFRALIGTEV